MENGKGVAAGADANLGMDLSAHQYLRLKELFDASADLDTGERSNYLDSECPADLRAEVERLIAADDADDANSEVLESSAAALFGTYAVPETIGEFKVIREIGAGGMGTVYEAKRETESYTQHAAVKVIRRGMNNETILRRFCEEQRILASLSHQNIARFLTGGTTENGSPFYAMEFVKGEPIAEYCKNRSLSHKEIALLFRDVCSAVSYAHSQLIVHRDLKPSNILVEGDGIPKLLDFGIAKVLEADDASSATVTQLGMMTPQYASPEQVRGEKVTTASDVYSLGMILCELLTGELPYRTETKTLAEIIATVSSDGRSKSNFLRERLKGDIEQILLKALQSDPARRYRSVESFSDDLRRWVTGLTVSARPESFGYRVSKFVSRNRAAVAGSVFVFISLISGVLAFGWQARRAEEQRRLADRRFSEVRNLANNVVFKYHDEIAKLDGSTGVREMLVTDALTYLDTLAADSTGDVSLQHELGLAYLKLGDVQGRLYSANTGNTMGAHESYSKAVSLLESALALDPANAKIRGDLFTAYDSLLFLLNRVHVEPGVKDTLIARTGELIRDQLAAEPDDTDVMLKAVMHYIRSGDAHGQLGDLQSLTTKLNEHLKMQPLIERLRAKQSDDPKVLQVIARAYQRLGTDHMWLGDAARKAGDEEAAAAHFEQAIPYHQNMVATVEALSGVEKNASERRRVKIAAYSSIAESLAYTRRVDEALRFAKDALGLAIKAKTADSANREAEMEIGNVYSIIGKIYKRNGDARRAAESFASAVQAFRKAASTDRDNLEAHTRVQESLSMLADLDTKLPFETAGPTAEDRP